MMEAQLILATIAQRYHLRLAPGTAVELEPQITLSPRGGLPMVLAERQMVERVGEWMERPYSKWRLFKFFTTEHTEITEKG
ncbi:MAG: hypothetical protein HC804_11485 [Anaerolineae bacterium]|nr:hypothetical protein [Anaerolineae bacterium]